VATQARAAQRKTRWSTPPPRPSPGTHAQPYRRRRPETTTLHRLVREHLETYLALADESDPMGDGVPDHVEKEFRSYLKCGILAHGFARARCATCGYDFLVAFSCKGRGACPSCNAKRMAETAAHLVDHLFPHVPVRQFVLSVPKRLRPYLHHRPRTASAVLHILLRALRATLREACPTAPPTASIGAVSFLHRFGSSLNPHFHYHLIVVDGLFQRVEDDTDQTSANPETRLRFHEATGLTHELLERLQHTVRSRVLRHFARHGLLEPHEAQDMLAWNHGGGFSLDASVRIEATDRAGLERLIRYCARPPFALDRLHLVDDRSDQILYILPGPDLAGHTALRLSALEFLDRLATILPPPRIHRHRYHGVFAPNAPLRPLVSARTQEDNALAIHTSIQTGTLPPNSGVSPPTSGAPQAPAPQPPDTTSARPSRWAALLARIYEVFPLVCPTCQTHLTFIALLTDPEPISQILVHIGEPTSPPLLHPARGPPQTELAIGTGQAEQDEVAQDAFPDDLDQTTPFDPAEPEPIPQDHFDQSGSA
jgi:predicted Zn-ribbon and HTH transcriptional regulator